MTIHRRLLSLKNESSIFGFEKERFDSGATGNDFLTIHGERVVDLGFDCPSDTFIFENVSTSHLASPHQWSSRVNEGLSDLDPLAVDYVSAVLPTGTYIASLLKVQPRIVTPGGADDYFANEFRASTDREHDPRTQYFRSISKPFVVPYASGDTTAAFHELIAPLYPPEKCDEGRVREWEAALKASKPSVTAVALSMFDFVCLSNWGGEFEPVPQEQWVLTHHLLDGHHKVFAASRSHREIQVLSFLHIGRGSGEEPLWDELFRLLDDPERFIPSGVF